MARLHIIFDPNDRLIPPGGPHGDYPPNLRAAVLPVSANLSEADLYQLARRLAELLLEQLAVDQRNGS